MKAVKTTKTELDLQHKTPRLDRSVWSGLSVSTYPISAGLWSPNERKENDPVSLLMSVGRAARGWRLASGA